MESKIFGRGLGMDGMELALLMLLKSNLVAGPTRFWLCEWLYRSGCMSGCFSGGHLRISVAVVNYAVFLVCRNNTNILGDMNKIIYNTFDYMAYLLTFYHTIFCCFKKLLLLPQDWFYIRLIGLSGADVALMFYDAWRFQRFRNSWIMCVVSIMGAPALGLPWKFQWRAQKLL